MLLQPANTYTVPTYLTSAKNSDVRIQAFCSSRFSETRENLVIFGYRICILEHISLHPGTLLITGTPKTNIVVRIRW